jgi:hypothetical protein
MESITAPEAWQFISFPDSVYNVKYFRRGKQKMGIEF